MAIASSIVVGIFGLSEGLGPAVALLFIYLLFGTFLAAFVGPLGGGLLGGALVGLERVSSAPIVGALTPAIVFVPASLVWGAIDDGSRVIEAGLNSGGLALLYAPFGFAAGKLFARQMRV